MRLRVLRSFLLSVLFAIALSPLPIFAQSPSDAELSALDGRISTLYQAENYREAIPLAAQYLATAKARHGDSAPQYAMALIWQARLLQVTKRLSEAEPLLRRALAIEEKTFGLEHPNVALVLKDLAPLLADTNRFAEAELLARRALAIDEKSLGPNSPSVAFDLTILASLLKKNANTRAHAYALHRR
jgi:tetratricopeptide (TPR) repeat protein